MSYMDMTFCRGDGCQKFNGCFRALTPEVQSAADKWWGGLPREAMICTYCHPKDVGCYQAPDKSTDRSPDKSTKSIKGTQ